MNTNRYITDKLFYKNNQLFYEDIENKKNIKVNKKNWIEYLNEYGWFQIEENDDYKSFGILDCGSCGDCLFNVISEALNTHINNENNFYDSKLLRKIVSFNVNKHNFDNIIYNYKLQYDLDEINGNWNPYLIKNIRDLKFIIKNDCDFWGDYLCIDVLHNRLKKNFIVLNEEFTIQNYFFNSKYTKTIILLNIDNTHFQLIGNYNGKKMCTVLKNNIINHFRKC